MTGASNNATSQSLSQHGIASQARQNAAEKQPNAEQLITRARTNSFSGKSAQIQPWACAQGLGWLSLPAI